MQTAEGHSEGTSGGSWKHSLRLISYGVRIDVVATTSCSLVNVVFPTSCRPYSKYRSSLGGTTYLHFLCPFSQQIPHASQIPPRTAQKSPICKKNVKAPPSLVHKVKNRCKLSPVEPRQGQRQSPGQDRKAPYGESCNSIQQQPNYESSAYEQAFWPHSGSGR